MTQKAGYVAIIGKPNSGKSTLMNLITGAKLSIVTHKAQTTRKKVLGIYSDENYQIVFLDTPGILNPTYQMHNKMMVYVEKAIEDADIVSIIIDVERFKTAEAYFTNDIFLQLRNITKPLIFLINKTDLIHDKKSLLPMILELNKYWANADIMPISALKNDNIKEYVTLLKSKLPNSEFLFDPELLSTHSQRFFVSEIIREVIFLEYKEEVPYSTEVLITEFKEREKGKWYIAADIIIEREAQKKIIIGKNGEKLRIIGSIARKQIEKHLEYPIYLDLFVKIRANWRDNPTFLKSYGY